ncbi:MAG: PepSY domain-containing protein [Holophagales bacterium]|nr:PepSY domain-containing protein [Holophagales bacterium]
MDSSTRRPSIPVLLCTLALAGAPATAADEPKAAEDAGFTGRWALTQAKDNVNLRSKSSGWSVTPGSELGAGGVGGMSGGGGFDLPLEVMTDARLLVVVDDGKTLRVTYPTGRKRDFVTDGQKRYLDDGDGPADVTSRRYGSTVTVASEWFRGYKLRETWELFASPRRLVVSGRVKGRESQQYVRTYEPAPPELPSASAGAAGAGSSASTAPAEPTPDAAPVAAGEPTPALVDRLGECTILAPRNATSAELNRLVRVSQDEAGKVAVASVAPLKAGDVISSDVEPFEGCLVWPFTLRLAGRKGVQEVFVDAGDGKVVRSEFVPMGPSAGEAPAP